VLRWLRTHIVSFCAKCTAGKQPGGGNFLGCVRGKAKPISGDASCANCPSGKWQNGSGQLDCYICPAGKHPEAQAEVCSNCTAGEISCCRRKPWQLQQFNTGMRILALSGIRLAAVFATSILVSSLAASWVYSLRNLS